LSSKHTVMIDVESMQALRVQTFILPQFDYSRENEDPSKKK